MLDLDVVCGEDVIFLLVVEHLLEKPCDDREVLPLVVCGKEDGVFVTLRHCGLGIEVVMNVCEVGFHACSQKE